MRQLDMSTCLPAESSKQQRKFSFEHYSLIHDYSLASVPILTLLTCHLTHVHDATCLLKLGRPPESLTRTPACIKQWASFF